MRAWKIALFSLGVAVSCKEREKPAAPAPAVTAPIATALPDSGAPVEKPSKKPLTDAEKAELARYRDALGRGRKATVAKDYPGAIKAFDDALAARPGDPRAVSERGYARLLAREYAEAREDLDQAEKGTKDSKLLATIYFNQGLVLEALGEGPAAKLYYARSNQLSPTKAAKDKLAGKPQCVATVDRAPVRADVAADWFGVWDAMARTFKRATGGSAPERPATEEAVKQRVCDTTCAGPGPWITIMGGAKASTGAAYAAFAVQATPDAKLAVWAIDTGGPYGACGASQEREITRAYGVRVHVRKEEMRRTLVRKANEQPCDGSEPFDDCVNACVPTSWTEEDWFLDPTKLARVLRITDGGSLDDAGKKRASIVTETGGTVLLTSGGCDEKFSLK